MRIKDIYHGNNTPVDRFYSPGSQYAKLSKEWLTLSDEFVQGLSDKQRELFDKLTEIQSQQTEIINEDTYIQGFRHGASIMLDMLSGDDRFLK